jgi:sugar phosphate isomerase/epimerase
MYKIGLHSWTLAHLPVEEALQTIADAGFTEAELMGSTYHIDPRIYNKTKLPRLARTIKNMKLHICSMHAPIDSIDLSTAKSEEKQQTLNLLTQSIEYCHALNIKILVVHPTNPKSNHLDTYKSRENCVDTLETILPVAEEHGVTLALENMIEMVNRRFGCWTEDLVDVAEDVKSSCLGVCLDVGHANLAKSSTLEDEVLCASKHLIHLHVHDNDGKSDGHLVPKDGTVDWDALANALSKVHYEGVFMTEIQGNGNVNLDFLKQIKLECEKICR